MELQLLSKKQVNTSRALHYRVKKYLMLFEVIVVVSVLEFVCNVVMVSVVVIDPARKQVPIDLRSVLSKQPPHFFAVCPLYFCMARAPPLVIKTFAL